MRCLFGTWVALAAARSPRAFVPTVGSPAHFPRRSGFADYCRTDTADSLSVWGCSSAGTDLVVARNNPVPFGWQNGRSCLLGCTLALAGFVGRHCNLADCSPDSVHCRVGPRCFGSCGFVVR